MRALPPFASEVVDRWLSIQSTSPSPERELGSAAQVSRQAFQE